MNLMIYLTSTPKAWENFCRVVRSISIVDDPSG